jgi:hypothetical protein
MATKWGSGGGGTNWGSTGSTTANPTTDAPVEATGEAPYTQTLQTNKKAVAESLLRLYRAGDVEGYKKALPQVQQVFTPQDMHAYGLDRISVVGTPGNWLGGAKSQIQKAETSFGTSTAGQLLGKVMTKLDAPRTVATAGLRQGLWGFGNVAEKISGGRIQGGVEGGWNQFREDLGNHVTPSDIFKSANANLESKGAAPITGGATHNLQRAGGDVGMVVLDPLTALGGTSKATEAMMETIGREVGESTAKKIAVHGLEGGVKKGIISEAEHQAVLEVIDRQAAELAASAEKGTLKRGLLPGTIKRQTFNLAASGDVAELAARAETRLIREGRAGLKFGVGAGKRTIIPSYIDGHSFLNPRLYAADIMRGGEVAASAAEPGLATGLAGVKTIEPLNESELKNMLFTADKAAPEAKSAVVTVPPLTPADAEHFVMRNADGKAAGILSIKDSKVEALYVNKALAPEAHAADKLYAAAQAAGHDVSALGADELTVAGRKAREGFLERQGGALTVDKALAQGERGSALQALPHTAEQTGLFPAEKAADQPWLNKTAEVTRRNPLDVLRQSGVGQAVGSALAPRSRVTAESGALASKALYRAQETTGASIAQQTHDLWLQLGKTSDKGIAALEKGAPKPLVDALPSLAGLKGREAFNEMMTAVAEQRLSPDTIAAVDALKGKPGALTKAANAIATAAERGGVVAHPAQEALTAAGIEAKPTVAKILSPTGEEVARGDAGLKLREALGIKPGEELKAGSDLTTQAVKVMRSEKGIKALNDALVERLGLNPGTKLFHEDVVASVALRSRATFEAAAMDNMYRGLANTMVDHNVPLISIVEKGDSAAAKAAADKNWIRLPGKQASAGDIYGPSSVMNELSKVNDIVINDEAMKGFRKFLDGWNGTWASYAINPLPFGTGFHARNATGNVLLSFLGGLTNPSKFAEAARVQLDLAKVRRLMSHEGLAFDQALEQSGISNYSKHIITNGRAHGVISAGFFADLDNYDLERMLNGQGQSVGQKVGSFIKDNKLLQANRRLGDVVENNARVALFMDSLEKTGSVTYAADTVKKYLFDYQDLTPFERHNMKSLNRFYTFMRKNTAVQLYALAHDPWKQKLIMMGESALYKDDPNAPIPDYAQKTGYNVSRFLHGGKGVDALGMNIDTPLDNAIKTLDPITQAVTMVPGLRSIVPPQYRSDKQQLTSALLNSRSGGPQEFVNFLFETATGKDTFSGKDISKESGKDTFNRLANAFLPLYGKAQRGLSGTVVGESAQPGMDKRLSVMQALTGWNFLPLTDKQRNQIAYVTAQELQNSLTKLKDQGVDVPSYTDLIRLGLAPDVSKLNKPNTKTKQRTGSQVTTDTTAKLNAARAALGQTSQTGIKPPATKAAKKKWG